MSNVRKAASKPGAAAAGADEAVGEASAVNAVNALRARSAPSVQRRPSAIGR
jgi:hypothetical protein